MMMIARDCLYKKIDCWKKINSQLILMCELVKLIANILLLSYMH